MSYFLRTARTIVAVALTAPIVPLAYIAIHGPISQPIPGLTACASTGGTCMKCVADSCPSLGYMQTLYQNLTTSYTRCVDFDGIPPGHCSAVIHKWYQVLDCYRNGESTVIGTCIKADCAHGTVNPNQSCDNPLYL